MTDEVIKVVALNAWGRMGPWSRRLAAIQAELARLAPDVVGFQEIWDGDGGSTLDEIVGPGWHVHHARACEMRPGVFVGNAIASRHPIVEHAAWPLVAGAHDKPRNCVHALIATPWGHLPVFVTHLAWRFHDGLLRMRQLQQIAALIGERAPVQRGEVATYLLPPILMGDMNAEPGADEIRYLGGLTAPDPAVYFADCFAVRGDGPGYTWHRDNPFAALECSPNRRIDYIFVRGPDRWGRGEPLIARVAFDRPEAGVFASDHYGVYAELRASSKGLLSF
ncbi:MAG TPA: endonuclease/exonuclease/phosphatase family protein [Kofleriaceae bacterium]